MNIQQAEIKNIESSVTTIGPARVCYEAHWQERSIFISAPCQSAMEWRWHSLATAILLERLEDACVLAETILGVSLQFFVSEIPTSNYTEYLQLELTTSSDKVNIWLPARAHRKVIKHGDILNEPNLRWSSVSAKLKLAHIIVDAEDVKRLQKDSVLLIPASWKTKWLCSVEVEQFESSLPVKLNAKSGILEFMDSSVQSWPDRQADDESSLVEVYLDETVKMDPGQLLKLQSISAMNDSRSVQYSIPFDQAVCQCWIDQSVQFSASIFSIGSGYALRITECR